MDRFKFLLVPKNLGSETQAIVCIILDLKMRAMGLTNGGYKFE